MIKKPKNLTPFFSEKLSALTARELEIMKELLIGASPKEIAYTLKISYNTVLGHQRKLYRKLDINTIRELITKYSDQVVNDNPQNVKPQSEGAKPGAVFTRWVENKDALGSEVNITEQIEQIEEQYFPTITLTGELLSVKEAYAGIYAIPTSSTLESMRKMSLLSFKILGDGNCYAISLPTTDTRLEGNHNHYRKVINSKNGEILTVVIGISDLEQVPYWGTPVPFIKENIEFLQIHAYTVKNFNLKIWDIKFYRL